PFLSVLDAEDYVAAYVQGGSCFMRSAFKSWLQPNLLASFMKEFFYPQPYGKRTLYKLRMQTATQRNLPNLSMHSSVIADKSLPILV
ncbi:MAG: hypothetical protein QMD23_02595, partial [Candidatus Bathyarchaeia archaeon]|nr:hypothetical protein [Candidatus Bathyarchaeia archaeon]